MNRWLVGLIAALLAAPLGMAQWQEDPEGDARETVAEREVSHGRSGFADLHLLDIEETNEVIRFTVEHGSPPEPYIPSNDQTFTTIHFTRGSQEYALTVQVVLYVNTGEMGHFANLWMNGENGDFVGSPDAVGEKTKFTVNVPREWLLDDQGNKPAVGQSMTDIHATSRTGMRFICIDTLCGGGTLAAEDRLPDNGFAPEFEFQVGIPQDGDISLHSDVPLRWSNGGATTYVYEIKAWNQGSETDFLKFEAKGLPSEWLVAALPTLEILPGELKTIPYAVQVGDSHAHGQDVTFILEARGIQGTGRVELGVHYAKVPQPTGHHAQVHIHTRDMGEEQIFVAVNGAVGANWGQMAFINTVDPYDDDDGVPVPGTKNNIGGNIDQSLDGDVPEYGVIYTWAVPLSPGLRVGLDVQDEITEGTIDLEFDIPVGTVEVTGRLAALDDGNVPYGTLNIDSSVGQTLAVLESNGPQQISGAVSVPVTLDGEPQMLPFNEDRELVLFIDAFISRPDAPMTPNTGVYLIDGDMVLPLAEYHDSIPVNLMINDTEETQAVDQIGAAPNAEQSKDTPSTGALALAGILGFGAIGLRRRMR